MIERPTLGGTNVIKDCTRSGGRSWAASEAKAFQRQDSEMIFQQRNCVIRCENPVVQRRLRPSSLALPRQGAREDWDVFYRPLKQWRNRSIQKFLRRQLFQLVLRASQCVVARKFCGAKFSGGQIQCRESNAVSDLRQGRQNIVFVR